MLESFLHWLQLRLENGGEKIPDKLELIKNYNEGEYRKNLWGHVYRSFFRKKIKYTDDVCEAMQFNQPKKIKKNYILQKK